MITTPFNVAIYSGYRCALSRINFIMAGRLLALNRASFLLSRCLSTSASLNNKVAVVSNQRRGGLHRLF